MILESQLKDIEATEQMKECLELRLVLIKTNYSKKDSYERNEIDITIMKTAYQIDKLNILLIERKQGFEESYQRFIEELEFEEKQIA